VFSTHLLYPSVSWRNAGLYWALAIGVRAQLAAYAYRDETELAPLWTMDSMDKVNRRTKLKMH